MKVVENAYSGNVLSMILWKNKVNWMGGENISFPVNLSTRNNVGSYSGFDAFPTNQENVRVKAYTYPSQLFASGTISGIQKAVNTGDQQVINIVAEELKGMSESLKQELGTQLYSDGTSNSNKDILGLQAAVDDSTSIATYLGISRSTYTNWKATRTAQSGSLSLANLAADFDAAQIGTDAPNLIVTTPAVFTIYEALMTPTVAHNLSFNGYDMMTPSGIQKGIAAGNGFRSLYFRGTPLVADEKCTSGNIYTLNTNHLALYYLTPSSDMTEGGMYDGFGWTGWMRPTNQDAVTGQLITYLQLICDSPRTNARRTGVTS